MGRTVAVPEKAFLSWRHKSQASLKMSATKSFRAMRPRLNFMVTPHKHFVWRGVNKAYEGKHTIPVAKLGDGNLVKIDGSLNAAFSREQSAWFKGRSCTRVTESTLQRLRQGREKVTEGPWQSPEPSPIQPRWGCRFRDGGFLPQRVSSFNTGRK